MRTRRRTGGDDGFALPFVLLVIAVVTVAVAATLTVTTPNIATARDDANGQRAAAAARAGVDDAEAWLQGDPVCRSTTRICDKAYGADSATMTRPALTAVGAAVRWRIDPDPTVDGYLRVRSTATVDRSTRNVVADLALAPSILSYGYYSDYESISPDVLVDQNPKRSIQIDNGTWNSSVSSPRTLTWDGITSAGAAPCGLHWWDDNGVPGRARNANTSTGSSIVTAYSESGTGNGATRTRTGNCNVVFTAGNVFDGPIYTRDAMLISQDATGAGPVFNQPVTTGWGFGTHNSPAAPTTPWLRNQGSGCCSLSSSPQQPTVARFDLQLPPDIGTEGVATNACVYLGPTRVVLNGDGTATVTSPLTRAVVPGADGNCYPSDLSAGVVGFPVAYANGVGGGTIVARKVGSQPNGGWAETAVRSTDTAPTAAGSAMWLVASGGAANGPTSAASDTCASSTSYAATAGAACAWSELPDYRSTTPTDGWKAYSSTATCSTLNAPTDQKQFECDLQAAPTGSTVGTYAAFRAAVKARLAATPCTGDVPTQQACVVAALRAVLPPATAKAAYQPFAVGTPVPADGTPVNGGVPAAPGGSDDLFTPGPTTPSKQTPTSTTLTYRIDRQTLASGKVTATVPQFTLTVTDVAWRTSTAGQATAYFPSLRDVTPYGRADGLGNAPGDLYVEGVNKGKVSLLGDQDVVVTGDVVDVGTDPRTDAVNIVAGGSVRNYNPVSCLSGAATSSIAATASGWCPDDLTGITSTQVQSNGTFTSTSGPAQYVLVNAPGDRRIDAALFALQGSFSTDNADRAGLVGNVTVNGGVYQEHRGVNGFLYSSSGYQRRTGYVLKYRYVDLRPAKLPYEPTTKSLSGRVWRVVSITGGGAS